MDETKNQPSEPAEAPRGDAPEFADRNTASAKTDGTAQPSPVLPGPPDQALAPTHGELLPSAETLEPQISSPVPRPLVVRVFFGHDGLRAGWRFAIYFLLVVILGGAVGRVMRAIGHSHRMTGISAWTVVISDTILLAIVLVPSLIMGMIEKRSLADYFLPLRHAFGRRFWEGALWGFVALTVLLAAIGATGDLTFGQVDLHGSRLLYYAAVWGLAFTLVGLAEEYGLRGYSQFTLARGLGFWPAALILSIAFAWLHRGNPGENTVGLLDVVVIALFFCLTLRVTGNLWFAIGYHAAWDWGETFFYGVPNSGMAAPGHLFAPSLHGSPWITGGTAGPEGSVFSLALTCVVAALFAVRFRKKSF